MTIEELQAQVAELTRQVQGVAAERNTYRQELDATKQQLAQLNGGGGGGRTASGHPFADLGGDPAAADAWVKAQAEALVKAQGFITQAQVDTLMNNARVASMNESRIHGLLWRGIDRLTTQEKYKALADPSSEFSKKVAQKLQDLGLGKPLHDKASDFATDWAYDVRDPSRPHLPLQQAAELTWAEMEAEKSTAGAAVHTGQAAQAAAGLGAGAGAGSAAAGVPKVDELIASHASPEAVSEAFAQSLER